jgi:hypothetical protein
MSKPLRNSDTAALIVLLGGLALGVRAALSVSRCRPDYSRYHFWNRQEKRQFQFTWTGGTSPTEVRSMDRTINVSTGVAP